MKPSLFSIGSGLSWKLTWTSFVHGFAFCLPLLLMCQVFVIDTCVCLSKTIAPCSVLSFSLSSLPPFFLPLACLLAFLVVVTKVYLETSCLLFVWDRKVSSNLQTKSLRTGLIWWGGTEMRDKSAGHWYCYLSAPSCCSARPHVSLCLTNPLSHAQSSWRGSSIWLDFIPCDLAPPSIVDWTCQRQSVDWPVTCSMTWKKKMCWVNYILSVKIFNRDILRILSGSWSWKIIKLRET